MAQENKDSRSLVDYPIELEVQNLKKQDLQFPNVFVSSNHVCRYSTHIIAKKSYFTYTIKLPIIEERDYGKVILVTNETGAALSILPNKSQTIGSASSLSLSDSSTILLFATKEKWVKQYDANDASTIIPGVAFDTTYTNVWFNGASPKFNTTSQQFQLGFIDEFTGSTINSRWSTNTGTDGTITVNGSLRLQDGTSGTDITHIGTPVLQSFNSEFQFHLTRNASANSTNAYVGLFAEFPLGASTPLAYYVGINQSSGGTKTVIHGDGTTGRTAAITADALWLRMVVNSHGYTVFYTAALAESSEPTTSDWSFMSGGINTLVGTFAPNYFVLASNAYGAAASDYTFRHLKFRYT